MTTNYVNTNNIHNLPNTIHHVVPAGDPDAIIMTVINTTCNATIATPHNSTTIIAKVTCKRCLAKLGKLPSFEPVAMSQEDLYPANFSHHKGFTPGSTVISVPEIPAFDESLEANTPDEPISYTEAQLNHVAELIKSGAVVPPKSVKASKPANIHLFHERSPEDVQKNGKPRPNTLCSISGGTTTVESEVTCKVCLSVMAKHQPKIYGESK